MLRSAARLVAVQPARLTNARLTPCLAPSCSSVIEKSMEDPVARREARDAHLRSTQAVCDKLCVPSARSRACAASHAATRPCASSPAPQPAARRPARHHSANPSMSSRSCPSLRSKAQWASPVRAHHFWRSDVHEAQARQRTAPLRARSASLRRRSAPPLLRSSLLSSTERLQLEPAAIAAARPPGSLPLQRSAMVD